MSHIERLNHRIRECRSDHPARRFLESFMECRQACVGKEAEGIDQKWTSARDGREHRFSSFAYEWLAFDVVLDGWLEDAPEMTESEQAAVDAIAEMRLLVRECQAAALADENQIVVALCEQVGRTLSLWENCIIQRLAGK